MQSRIATRIRRVLAPRAWRYLRSVGTCIAFTLSELWRTSGKSLGEVLAANLTGPSEATTLGDTKQSKDRFITEVYDEVKDFRTVVDGGRRMPRRTGLEGKISDDTENGADSAPYPWHGSSGWRVEPRSLPPDQLRADEQRRRKMPTDRRLPRPLLSGSKHLKSLLTRIPFN